MSSIPPKDPFKKDDSEKLTDVNEPSKKKEPLNEGFESLYNYTKSNVRDLVTYVLLILGIILLFFQPFYGQLLIGMIAAVYFSTEITWLIRNAELYIERHGLVRSIVVGVTLLAFFISAPFIFIGAAIIVLLKFLILSEHKE